MPLRSAGVCLILASASFWVAWVLMPGVGVTDAALILSLVGAHRESVLASVVLQLLSAALYAPGALGIAYSLESAPSRLLRVGATLLVMGAMGSAADAIFHLVAYEMTAPGLEPSVFLKVLAQLQGPDLALLLPLLAAFFLGHALLLTALRKRGRLQRAGARLLFAAPFFLALGVPAIHAGLLSRRAVGLAVLFAVAGSLALVGGAMALAPPEAREMN